MFSKRAAVVVNTVSVRRKSLIAFGAAYYQSSVSTEVYPCHPCFESVNSVSPSFPPMTASPSLA